MVVTEIHLRFTSPEPFWTLTTAAGLARSTELALDCIRAGGPGFDSRGRTNTQCL